MTYTKLLVETAAESRDILLGARGEIEAEMLRRHPGDSQARNEALDRSPLRMKIFFNLDASLEHPAVTLGANTVREALDIIEACLTKIQATQLLRYPGNEESQVSALQQTLRMSIHYDLADLDREGPLYVEDCLFLPYNGIPRGLRPSVHRGQPEARQAWPARGRPQRRGLARAFLGP
ncbi:hypothetical protein [Streptomyces ipomoeae]|uniref:hypothetical protein n=1 Tax=Streptomyces ipomoeae TaxID=103232 RepID=UPI0011467BB9|nr:hypothetical protein [Streptomyces ipomoeae]TQE33196.1 hypothetical protein Sipo7851_22150 [Streptomyces ipomoeae]